MIFRELYLQGLTLMDVREANIGIALGLCHVAARNEVRALVSAIKLPPGQNENGRITERYFTVIASEAQQSGRATSRHHAHRKKALLFVNKKKQKYFFTLGRCVMRRHRPKQPPG